MKNDATKIKEIAEEIIYQSLVEWEERHADTINQTTQKIVNRLIDVYRKKVFEQKKTI
mgnify:CR=1 FL=1